MQTKQDILNRPEDQRYHYLDSDNWVLDIKELDNIVNEKTKLILVNTPHNPTGKIFTQ